MNFKSALFQKITFVTCSLSLALLVVDLGFISTVHYDHFLGYAYLILMAFLPLRLIQEYLQNRHKQQLLRVSILNFATIFSYLIIAFTFIFVPQDSVIEFLVRLLVILIGIRIYAEHPINYYRLFLNPAQLFIASFLVIIIIGTIILKFPNMTTQPLSFIDSLFTATSAVCVTGLIVVDTGTDFTIMGQLVIMILIQIGGLGILTFASSFIYFFKDGASYQAQFSLNSISSSKNLGSVFQTLRNIIIITISIEFLAAIFIFLTTSSSHFSSTGEHLFFSIFHAVSAFCNAGFSTFSDGMYAEGIRYNYSFQFIILSSFVLGGLGFPIVLNILAYFKRLFLHLSPFHSNSTQKTVRLLNLDTRIIIITTILLIFCSLSLFLALEYDNTLAKHNGFGKFMTSAFSVCTPRTAGFNTVDIATLQPATLILVILLMWIGASPASTGGGIKTSTFAVALLNILSLARGKKKLELFNREIAEITIHRAFAIITLSILVIGVGTMLVTLLEPKLSAGSILFECVSAYGTVGLSLGITAKLCTGSKLLIICMMFIGRVSMLSLLIALFKKKQAKHYTYPKEEISIN